MTLLHTPQFSNWARGHLRCRVEGAAGRFAPTFDDGPSATWTSHILDALAEHGARATFFMLARNVRRAPQVVRRTVEEGHEAALHGALHWPLPLLPPWAIRAEVERCAFALASASGARARLYRPAFGLMFPSQARYVRDLGYEPVLGDVYPEDPRRPGVDRIVARVLPRLTSGSILILHDGSPYGAPDRSQTVAALRIILGHATRAGLAAVTVSELLQDAAGREPTRASRDDT